MKRLLAGVLVATLTFTGMANAALVLRVQDVTVMSSATETTTGSFDVGLRLEHALSQGSPSSALVR